MTAHLVMEILVGDASRLRGEALALALSGRGYRLRGIETTREGLLGELARRSPDVCLLDASLLDGSPLDESATDLIARVRAGSPDSRVVVLSRSADPKIASEAIDAGAVAYVRKDRGLALLDRVLRQVAEGAVRVEPATDLQAVRHPGMARDRPFHWLTQREREVLRRLTEGDDTVAIARALGMTTNTARTHVQNVLDKLGVHSRLEAVALVHRLGEARRYGG